MHFLRNYQTFLQIVCEHSCIFDTHQHKWTFIDFGQISDVLFGISL